MTHTEDHSQPLGDQELLSGFTLSVARFPSRRALEVGHRTYTYAELANLAARIAAAIGAHDGSTKPFAALLAHRSATAYSAVLGILQAGKGYVPLHPRFPIDRTIQMVEASAVDTVVVDEEGLRTLPDLLSRLDRPLTLVCPTSQDGADLAERFTGHTFINAAHLPEPETASRPRDRRSGEAAYLLFTSGSSGTPKGVAVSHRSVLSYLSYVGSRYEVTEEDRFSQTFDLTFDLSVHDMFLAWGHGACLCTVPERATMAPAKFIRDKRITMWFSVPSVVSFMQRMRLLKPGAFPSIRYSLFCGEPLLAASATAWQDAAPNSIVENLYGPTEATIAISHYRWLASGNHDASSGAKSVNDIVPIGTIFTGQRGCIVDTERHPVRPGVRGELYLSGSQVTSGYLNNPAKTEQQFARIEGDDATWYRTGDLVCQDEVGCLHYVGRIDNQIQVRGHRVELAEVERALRHAGNESAVALGWPPFEGSAEAIYGVFLEDDALDPERILEFCRKTLPWYMVPTDIVFLPDIPLNANGKVDRRALAHRLRETLDERTSA